MNEGTGVSNIIKYGLIALVVLLLIGAGALWAISGQDGENQLMPSLPTPTPPTSVPQQELEIVAFTALNEDPLAYLNQAILVKGDYLPLDKAECSDPVGPDIRWSLTADNLQLDAKGFERIVQLLPVGTNMTVQGIWRLHQGPLGCGKGPSRESVWYLDAKKIIQPNPLVGEGGQAIAVEVKDHIPGLPEINLTETAINAEPTATLATDTITEEATLIAPTSSEPIIPTQTSVVPGEITPSATAPQQPTSAAPTNTPDPNATLPPASASATAVPTDNPQDGTPTFTPEAPPILPTSTETNGGGYPGPEGTATLTPTASPNPYP